MAQHHDRPEQTVCKVILHVFRNGGCTFDFQILVGYVEVVFKGVHVSRTLACKRVSRIAVCSAKCISIRDRRAFGCGSQNLRGKSGSPLNVALIHATLNCHGAALIENTGRP